MKAIVFDLFETVFSLDSMRARLSSAGFPEGTLDLWFARILRDGFALAASEKHKPFVEVARNALQGLAGRAPPELLAGFQQLDAHPDAGPAMEKARRAGVRVATLSNGSAEGARGLLRRNGLDAHVSEVLSIDDARRWKPHRDAYLTAVGKLGLAPAEVALVAVHSWDVHGARAAGLRSGWCSRLETTFNETFDRADAEGASLVEVVERLLALK